MGCMHAREQPESPPPTPPTPTPPPMGRTNTTSSITASGKSFGHKPPVPALKIPRHHNSAPSLPSLSKSASTGNIDKKQRYSNSSLHSAQRSSSLRIPRKTSAPSPRHSLAGSTPPSVETFLAKRNNKRRKLPSLPKFGAPLTQQTLRSLKPADYQRDSIILKDDYKQIPDILIQLKKYLLRFHGYQYIGIFANGSISNIDKYHNQHSEDTFVRGYVSKVDVFGMKSLIESDKIDTFQFDEAQETHYAMVFAELIKLWLQYMTQRLLNVMPSTYFEEVTSIQLFRMRVKQIPEPYYSTFLFILDICVEAANNATVNQMNVKRVATVIGPYLFKDADVGRNEELKPVLIRFCEIGMMWRKGKNY